jgi:hypothetical protein
VVTRKGGRSVGAGIAEKGGFVRQNVPLKVEKKPRPGIVAGAFFFC